MIGLVVTKRAAQTVAGVTPLSKAYVWRIKAKMKVLGNILPIVVTASPTAIAIGFGLAAWRTHDTLVAFLMLTCMMLAVNCAARTFGMVRRRPDLIARWQTVPYYPGFHEGGGVRVPTEAKSIANRCYAEGLSPQIEYFDHDPFLFVQTRHGRVYLYHW
jgi:hypothetical protein